MSNLSKLEFVALDISGKDYLSWVLDAEIHLAAKALENIIIQENEISGQDKAKAMIFLRHHLDGGLKTEYLTLKDPFELWSSLKERYDHLKATILPRARYEWIHLRLQDFKTVSEYNSVVFRITSQLKLCGKIMNDEDLLEKTLSTFHASNMVLQQQYREKGLKKYSELISCLLVAEQHNTLLMKNHEARPTGSAPFSEVNMVATTQKSERRQNYYRSRGHSHGRGQGHGRGRNNYRHHGENKWENNKDPQNNPLKGRVNICHRCGMKGHWARVCRTPDHFVKLYQASNKRKDNNVEAHLTFKNDDDKAGPSNKYDDVE
uniref:CCHC-type domain-containing protein n=1 Tax=Nicotiana tabacum TaxID=4097 RepID=A0A1S4BBX6_TOBAC